jgi:branched-chain amino acid aminotransferase
MSLYLSFNGTLHKAETPLLPASNRAYRFGEGAFETMLRTPHQLLFAGAHFERLQKALSLLRIQIPPYFTATLLENTAAELVQRNQIHGCARVRLSVSRGNGGLYDYKEPEFNWLMEVFSFDRQPYYLNDNGLDTVLFTDLFKACTPLAACKTSDHLVYAQAAVSARLAKCNDAFVINQYGRICDSSMGNIFVYNEGKFFTPPLTEGCIEGIMRRHLLQVLPHAGYEIIEAVLTPEETGAAEEIFISNVIRGIRWVKNYNNRSYANRHSRFIFDNCVQPLL